LRGTASAETRGEKEKRLDGDGFFLEHGKNLHLFHRRGNGKKSNRGAQGCPRGIGDVGLRLHCFRKSTKNIAGVYSGRGYSRELDRRSLSRREREKKKICEKRLAKEKKRLPTSLPTHTASVGRPRLFCSAKRRKRKKNRASSSDARGHTALGTGEEQDSDDALQWRIITRIVSRENCGRHTDSPRRETLRKKAADG